MKSEKGVTIVSLIIYVGVLFVVVLLVGKVTSFFFSNKNTIENPNSEADFNKLNLYMLGETKKENNTIKAIGKMIKNESDVWNFVPNQKGENIDNQDIENDINQGNAIQFYTYTNGEEEYNIIGLAGDGIYYNEIKICENVEEFEIRKSGEKRKRKNRNYN